MITICGKINFEPEPFTKKHKEQTKWKKTISVDIKGEMDLFYSNFIKKNYGISLIRPQRLSHLTIVADRYKNERLWETVKNKWNGKKIEITYDPDVRGNGEYWWLKAECKIGNIIRKELDLGKIYFPYHITIGSVKETDIEYNKYIIRNINNDYVMRKKQMYLKNLNIR